MDLKVVARLRDIPDRAIVTKKTGIVEHTVRRKIIIYGQNTPGRAECTPPLLESLEIQAQEGSVFMISAQGAIGAYGLDKEVVWHTSLDELNEQWGGNTSG